MSDGEGVSADGMWMKEGGGGVVRAIPSECVCDMTEGWSSIPCAVMRLDGSGLSIALMSDTSSSEYPSIGARVRCGS